MSSSLHDSASICICGWHSELCSLTIIYGFMIYHCHDFWCSWACDFYDRIILVFNVLPPEGPGGRRSKYWFSIFCLLHKHVSRFSIFQSLFYPGPKLEMCCHIVHFILISFDIFSMFCCNYLGLYDFFLRGKTESVNPLLFHLMKHADECLHIKSTLKIKPFSDY